MSEQWACSQVVPLVMQFPKQFYFFGFNHFQWRGYILTPPKSKGSPLWVKKQKNVQQSILIAQKKRPDALNATRKTSGLCKVRFWKKIRKNLEKSAFFAILAKKGNFLRFFLIFSETIFWTELRFFALHSVHQDASFELSKYTMTIFPFLDPKGGSL